MLLGWVRGRDVTGRILKLKTSIYSGSHSGLYSIYLILSFPLCINYTKDILPELKYVLSVMSHSRVGRGSSTQGKEGITGVVVASKWLGQSI